MQSRFRKIGFGVLGGILFAAFDRCGYLLKHYGSIWVLSDNPWHRTVFHRILCRLPLSVLAVVLLLSLTDRLAAGTKEARKAERQDPLWILWAVFFASFLPAFLGGYPGVFAADAPNQVGWTFSGWLTAHHPLLHTGILCGIFSLTRAFGLTDNTAAAVYTLLQMAALSGVFAWILRFLQREKAPLWLQAASAGFLALVPFHGMMAVYTTKDTLFSGIFALCVIQIFRMCREPEGYFADRRQMVLCGLCFTLLFLFRNNGFHTLLLCVPFLLFFLRPYRKKLLLLFAGVLLVYLFCQGPLLKLLGAEPGNPREAYSIVMQTLGRTYAAGGDIRPEEMDVIRPVMDEETLAGYTPNLSDPIKNHFHTEAFEEEKIEFLKTWLAVGWRNKKIYIDAFLNTTAAFWYPGTSEEYLDFVCFDIEKENPAYPHVQMTPVLPAFQRYYTAVGTDTVFRRVPVLREFLSMGIYFWLMVYAALYLLYRRQYHRLLWILPLWTYMGTSFLGPAALLRYAYPVMLCAPLVLFFLITEQKQY